MRLEWLSAVNKIHPKISSATSLAMIYEEMSARILQMLGAKLVLIIRWGIQEEQPEILHSSRLENAALEIENLATFFQKGLPATPGDRTG